jgi:hypothetical protein
MPELAFLSLTIRPRDQVCTIALIPDRAEHVLETDLVQTAPQSHDVRANLGIGQP